MLNLKKTFASTVLAASLLFATAASAMTIAEYKAMDIDKRAIYLTDLIDREIKEVTAKDAAVGRCLDNQFSVVFTTNTGIPDGILFIGQQVTRSLKKDPHGRTIESLVSKAADYIARKACQTPVKKVERAPGQNSARLSPAPG